jgi:hypothetical protein
MTANRFLPCRVELTGEPCYRVRLQDLAWLRD